MSLNNLSFRLADLGRREKALTAINEAVTIRRALAQALPIVFATRYANSLEIQAADIFALGHHLVGAAGVRELLPFPATLTPPG